MKPLRIEQNIPLEIAIKDLLVVNIDDHIDIQKSREGVLFHGQIVLSGKYRDAQHVSHDFSQTIPIHMMEPMETLNEREEIAFQITDFDYQIQDQLIAFTIQGALQGIKEAGPTFPAGAMVPEETPKTAEVIDFRDPSGDTKEVEILKLKQVALEPPTSPLQKENFNLIEKSLSEPSLQGLFRQSKVDVVWRFRVILKGDSWASIANDYKLLESELIALNKNNEFAEGQLLLIPVK